MTESHAIRAHAPFAPSGAYRWLRCHGSVNLSAQAPAQPSGPSAEAGTIGHEFLQAAIEKREAAKAMLEPQGLTAHGFAYHFAAVNAPEKLRAALEVKGFGKFYADVHRAIMDTCYYLDELLARHPDLVVVAEEPVGIAENCWGTPDIVAFSPRAARTWCVDMKTGVHSAVVSGGDQVRTYGVGLRKKGYALPIIGVIVQPNRVGGQTVPDEWEMESADLDAHETAITAAIEAARMPNASLAAGEHCRFCPAEAFCPAREAQAVALCNENFTTVQQIDAEPNLPHPSDLSPERIAFILRNKGRMTGWLNAVEQYAMAAHRAGDIRVPDFKIVQGDGRRAFDLDRHSVDQLGAELAKLAGVGAETFVKRDMIGITEAEKLIVAGAKALAAAIGLGTKDRRVMVDDAKAAFEALLIKKPGAPTLVPSSDPRPEATAALAFAGVQIDTAAE
ncbi:MAG: DUF2800 domain-containing protein [Bradyrhizobium sp.]|nr:DUF2800 domain-containing protein [Bradyrhizobium sp.]